MVLRDFQNWFRSFFFGKIKCFPAKIYLFLPFGAVGNDIKAKVKFTDDHGYNFLRLFDILPNFYFAINEMQCGY